MIAVIIPVHNEERLLGRCLEAVFETAADRALGDEHVEVIVVLNGCTDASAEVARRTRAIVVELETANVGAARRAGGALAVERGARWLAFTDADTHVAHDWLAAQLSHDSDVVCGTVGVDDWSPHGVFAGALHRHFSNTYHDADGHRHIHGANLGVATAAYIDAGGFNALACSEDVALVQALQRRGASIAWSARPRVTTSARVEARAPGGFGDTLVAVVRAMDPSPHPLPAG